jgi:AraC family transcriptional regulator
MLCFAPAPRAPAQKEEKMPDIEIRELPAMTVVGVPHSGPYHRIGPAFEALGRILGEAGAHGAARGWLGLYHDSPETTPVSELRSHAAAVWAGGAPVPEGLETIEVPGGRYAVLTYRGAYEGLADAWRGFTPEAIAAAGGASMRYAAAMEIYVDDPQSVPPGQARTELCLAVL